MAASNTKVECPACSTGAYQYTCEDCWVPMANDQHQLFADMLEALKGAVTLAEMLVWPKSMGGEVAAALRARLAAIHAAISKAERSIAR
jgi:hypothetical protein